MITFLRVGSRYLNVNLITDTGEDAYEMVRTLEGVTEETERKRTKRSSTCD